MSSVSTVLERTERRVRKTETRAIAPPPFSLEEAEARAVDALANCGYRAVVLSAKVEIREQKLVLHGIMPSFSLLQVAQSKFQKAIGDVPAVYRLEVVK